MKKSSKQNVETIVLKNSKTGEALEFRHEQHKAEYGAKHFWKADKNSLSCFQRFLRQKVRYWPISCKRRNPQKMNLSEPIRPLPES